MTLRGAILVLVFVPVGALITGIEDLVRGEFCVRRWAREVCAVTVWAWNS